MTLHAKSAHEVAEGDSAAKRTMRVWPSGNLVDPLDPDPALIRIEDVAHHLAGIHRYGGASRLTVAQHCCEMVRYVMPGEDFSPRTRAVAFECLMHDAAEYLLGDMIAPLKHSAFGDVYRAAEASVERVLHERFGFGDKMLRPQVSYLDKRMRATEQRDLFGSDSAAAIPNLTIHEWNPRFADREFLRLYEMLRPREAQQGQVAA